VAAIETINEIVAIPTLRVPVIDFSFFAPSELFSPC
jgi:hypothetical protein